MLTNGIPGECTAVMEPNIHDILMKIDAVLSDANEQAYRIRNFLMSQTMTAEKEPNGGPTDMVSHVTDMNKKALALHDKINDIAQILGM